MSNVYNFRDAELPRHCGNCRFLEWEEEIIGCSNSNFISDEDILESYSVIKRRYGEDCDKSELIKRTVVETKEAYLDDARYLNNVRVNYYMVCDLHEFKIKRLPGQTYSDHKVCVDNLLFEDNDCFKNRVEEVIRQFNQKT